MQLEPYVEYFFPGILMSEHTTRKLTAGGTRVAAALEQLPEGAFAFRLFELPIVPADTDEYQVIPKRKNESKMFYPEGTLHSIAEVESWGEDYRILASNMRGNGWNTVVKCRTGNFQPFESGDVVLGGPQTD